MLEGGKKDTVESFLASLENMDTESMFDIIHQHIQSLVARQESFGRRDPRTTRPNAVRITVTSVYGQSWDFMYIPKFLDGSNLYVFNGKDWIPDRVTKAVHPISQVSLSTRKTHQP